MFSAFRVALIKRLGIQVKAGSGEIIIPGDGSGRDLAMAFRDGWQCEDIQKTIQPALFRHWHSEDKPSHAKHLKFKEMEKRMVIRRAEIAKAVRIQFEAAVKLPKEQKQKRIEARDNIKFLVRQHIHTNTHKHSKLTLLLSFSLILIDGDS